MNIAFMPLQNGVDASTASDDDTSCRFQIDNNKWNFNDIVKSTNQDSYSITYKTSGQGNTTIYFNICKYVSQRNS